MSHIGLIGNRHSPEGGGSSPIGHLRYFNQLYVEHIYLFGGLFYATLLGNAFVSLASMVRLSLSFRKAIVLLF